MDSVTSVRLNLFFAACQLYVRSRLDSRRGRWQSGRVLRCFDRRAQRGSHQDGGALACSLAHRSAGFTVHEWLLCAQLFADVVPRTAENFRCARMPCRPAHAPADLPPTSRGQTILHRRVPVCWPPSCARRPLHCTNPLSPRHACAPSQQGGETDWLQGLIRPSSDQGLHVSGW